MIHWPCSTANSISLFTEGAWAAGFAAKVASDNRPRYLILDAPYFSFRKAVKRYLPILPTKILLRYHLRTDNWIRMVNCHTYIIHGTRVGFFRSATAKNCRRSTRAKSP